MHISKSIAAIQCSPTIALSDRLAVLRAAGRPVIDLASGDPDFDTPAHITSAGVSSLHAGRTHYGPSRGTSELREAIVQRLPEGIVRDPGTEVLVTNSAKFALSLALRAILDIGDEVIVLTPAWVSYAPLIRLHGGVPVFVHLEGDEGFSVTATALQAALGPRTKAIVVNNPTNPTGRVLRPDEIQAVVTVAEAGDLVIVSDEIYRYLVFQGEHASPAALAPDRTVVVDGVSKAYAMTGWRLGWLSGPSEIVSAALVAHQHMISCAPLFVQDAAVAALTGPQEVVASMLATYALRREMFTATLGDASASRFRAPEGTFYGYLDVGDAEFAAGDFAAQLLERTGVAVLPGTAFGGVDNRYVRLSLAVPTDDLEVGLPAIRNFLTDSFNVTTHAGVPQ